MRPIVSFIVLASLSFAGFLVASAIGIGAVYILANNAGTLAEGAMVGILAFATVGILAACLFAHAGLQAIDDYLADRAEMLDYRDRAARAAARRRVI